MEERCSSVAVEVLAALKEWQESFHALGRGDLCALVGCSDREVRAAVAELRRHGHLVVVADGGGYRIAQSVEELHVFTAVMRRRIQALVEAIEAMEETAARRFGDGSG